MLQLILCKPLKLHKLISKLAYGYKNIFNDTPIDMIANAIRLLLRIDPYPI
jgi:hypothetical protein